ncbi:class I SAM-dependent methyltransferase [Streptomyces caniferus]|uniref:Methyltransferase n=1 Tax=Streptomyces caniferus TaxID=285557 RepID=A0A640SLV6_9ACTN|nr:class I SAM-dependent methyltransferase [Streptomyces caniferus]GFE11732.1 methyltransferase [Streptomyces caniferus]
MAQSGNQRAGGRGRARPKGSIATGNARQAEAWDGEEGKYWAEERERYEARYRHLTPHLMAAAGLRAGSRVLDVGCGNGGTSLAAARVATDGSVLGVDLSGQQLSTARQRATAAGLRQVTFEQADAQVHRFGRGAFDVALSRFGVMFFAAPEAAFGNIAHALRPGGRLAFLCWRRLRENAYLTVPAGAIAPYAQPPDLDAPGTPGSFSLADADRIRKLLDGAGFDEISVGPVDEPMWMGADPDDATAHQLGIPDWRAVLAGASGEARGAARAALRRAMAEHHGPGGVSLGCAAWLVTGRRR